MFSRSRAELDTHVYTYLTLPTLITANALMDTEQSSDSLSTGMRNCVVNLGDTLARFLLFCFVAFCSLGTEPLVSRILGMHPMAKLCSQQVLQNLT